MNEDSIFREDNRCLETVRLRHKNKITCTCKLSYELIFETNQLIYIDNKHAYIIKPHPHDHT